MAFTSLSSFIVFKVCILVFYFQITYKYCQGGTNLQSLSIIMNNDITDKKDSYSLPTINDALDKLGMLSTITHSRKEYRQENENFFCKLQHLNMNGDKAGPSFVNECDISYEKNFLYNIGKPNEVESYKVGLVDPKEKENKMFDGLRIVTMNSQFITSFKTGYSFPLNELTDCPDRRKCTIRKRKCRSHPYDKKSLIKVIEHNVKSSIDSLNELDQTASRLRTASLSNGSSNRGRVAVEKCRSAECSGLKRSRSMENLIGSKENSSFVGCCDKTKDIETVSKGIQEMQMEDCT